MNQYTISAFIAFVLLGMGIVAVMLGGINYIENKKSKSGIQMFYVCWCVFFWDFGYAWMSLSFNDSWAYVFRAIALLSVTFYMFFILKYVALITEYPSKKLAVFLVVFTSASLVAWTQIIGTSAIEFVTTPWGYWYTSKLSWARILQFVSIIAALVQYYAILAYGIKNAGHIREKYILKRFRWFGVILFTGYIFDTLIPTIAHIPAIPGSSISAFFSAMLLYNLSRKNKTFGLTDNNVSQYVFREVTMPVLITDFLDNIVLYNDIAKAYFECDNSAFDNKPITSLLMELEDGVMQVSGTKKLCRLDKTVVNDQFGELLYTISFVQDITKDRENLRMLEESRREALEANHAKSNFLANISHEIRTPINAVLGLDEMILRECDDKNILGYAHDIEGAGRTLLSLINDILDISKIESGRMELVLGEYDVASLLSDSYNTVLMRAKEKNLVLNVERDENIPRGLYGDEVRIRQILTNFLSNAVKYTKEGNILMKAGYTRTSDTTIDLVVSVIDTGIGLTDEQKEELFTPFKRFDGKANRNIEGTGLGLSIAKSFAELMDGRIEVASTRGVGSTFTLVVPQKIVKDEPVGKMTRASGDIGTGKSQNENTLIIPDVKILAVDDVEMNLKVFAGLLKRTKAQVTTCLSGAECLEIIKKEKFDIIFLDHMMPGMDGVETFHKIKENSEHLNTDTPIIMLTANAIVGVQEEYMKEGFNDYLSKPLQWSALENMIKKYLK